MKKTLTLNGKQIEIMAAFKQRLTKEDTLVRKANPCIWLYGQNRLSISICTERDPFRIPTRIEMAKIQPRQDQEQKAKEQKTIHSPKDRSDIADVWWPDDPEPERSYNVSMNTLSPKEADCWRLFHKDDIDLLAIPDPAVKRMESEKSATKSKRAKTAKRNGRRGGRRLVDGETKIRLAVDDVRDRIKMNHVLSVKRACELACGKAGLTIRWQGLRLHYRRKYKAKRRVIN